jgi:hypothetical protein
MIAVSSQKRSNLPAYSSGSTMRFLIAIFVLQLIAIQASNYNAKLKSVPKRSLWSGDELPLDAPTEGSFFILLVIT